MEAFAASPAATADTRERLREFKSALDNSSAELRLAKLFDAPIKR
jgi:hypothetical protein